MKEAYEVKNLDGVAIIGMSGRFPGAGNIKEFWEDLKKGKEAISYFSKEDARNCGVGEDSLNDPDYILAGGIIEDIELFDADFFGMNPREAGNMDPQQRLFLECCHEALEDGGYSRNGYDYPIGVYAGSNMSYYFLYHLFDKTGFKDDFSMALGNDKDYVATRVSYEFNLKGPGINVQTACSTSMTAIAMAYEGLLNYHCDMALAGGSGIRLPQKSGYRFQEGFIASPDGHTRPFDANAYGTVFTSTVGVVLLKRLEDAIRDRDSIYAVIKGMAVNNDGSDKVGFTAPSREGQADVVAAAQELAGISPEDVGYIEAHGTGTSLGDPIEISALEKVFGRGTDKKMFCAVGSVKGNIGHAISGSGVAGMIKTALALKYGQIPPTINFESPNPKINFIGSPFYVNDRLSEWKSEGKPRIAGVSSFGFGGTNVHAVLAEAPGMTSTGTHRPFCLLPLSARTPAALERLCRNLSGFFAENPGVNLADAAYTLQTGRREFKYRRAFLCRDLQDAIRLLAASDGERVFSGTSNEGYVSASEAGKLFERDDPGSEAVLGGLAGLWVRGARIDWTRFYEDELRLRIPLPTYPFERKRHWVEQFNLTAMFEKYRQNKAKSGDYRDWLYLPTWKRAPSLADPATKPHKKESWLVFMDETGFGDRVLEHLKLRGIAAIPVRIADSFGGKKDSGYFVNPSRKEDFKELTEALSEAGHFPGVILHLWCVFNRSVCESRMDFAEKCRKRGFYSLLYLAQALGEKGLEERIRIAAVTNNMYEISDEGVAYPEKAVILGPCRVIPREYGNISCQSVDVACYEAGSYGEQRMIEMLLAEVTSKNPGFITALRGTHRWLQDFERIRLDSPDDKPGLVKEGAAYLITGGMGGIGLAMAGYMAAKGRVKLALTQRTPFPQRDSWSEWLSRHDDMDKTSVKLRKIMALEASGSEIMVINADITDPDEMRIALQEVEERLGTIRGVIHAAGVADNGPIAGKSAETAEKVLAPKVKGTLVIDELFKNKKPDYLVLFSSSSAVLGNAGFIDYCSANSFLDQYAQQSGNLPGTYTVSIGWDEWEDVGMAAENKRWDRVKDKISVHEGLLLLDRIVAAKPSPQVVVSPGDFGSMLESIRKFLQTSLNGAAETVLNMEAGNNRPELRTPYQRPGNETEERIADIWQKLLGVSPVGINDDFFQLGGHSLLATTLAAELAKKFRRSVSLQSLFERPTVAQLAELFQSSGAPGEDDGEEYEEGSL